MPKHYTINGKKYPYIKSVEQMLETGTWKAMGDASPQEEKFSDFSDIEDLIKKGYKIMMNEDGSIIIFEPTEEGFRSLSRDEVAKKLKTNEENKKFMEERFREYGPPPMPYPEDVSNEEELRQWVRDEQYRRSQFRYGIYLNTGGAAPGVKAPYATYITTNKPDHVNHPPHYTNSAAKCSKCSAPIECIDVTRHMDFNIGNAMKYLWRYKDKGGLQDLEKARWYLDDEIKKGTKDA